MKEYLEKCLRRPITIQSNTEILENYIRENYPKYPIISSTTKRMTDLVALLM